MEEQVLQPLVVWVEHPVQVVVRPSHRTATVRRQVRQIHYDLGDQEPGAPTRAAKRLSSICFINDEKSNFDLIKCFIDSR